jgi:hypothetical protein
MHSWIVPFPLDATTRRLVPLLESAHIEPVLRIEHSSPPASPEESRGTLFLISRPDWLRLVQETNPRAALEIPLHLYLCAHGERTEILFRTARECLAPYPDPCLQKIARRIDEACAAILDQLGDPTG